MAEPAPTSDLAMRANAIRVRACAAWSLLVADGCVAYARRDIRAILELLDFDAGLIDNAVTMVSELTTNALVHGLRSHDHEPVPGRPELWVYASTVDVLRITVFDPGDGWTASPRNAPDDKDAESGRGLRIVDALAREAGGRWGHHLSRARLGEHRMPGNAAWFELPLPAPIHARPVHKVPTPAVAIDRLFAMLRARGLNHLYASSDAAQALLSICTGLTVRYRNGTFTWTPPYGSAGPVRFPVTAEIDLVEELVSLHETLTRRPPRLPPQPNDAHQQPYGPAFPNHQKHRDPHRRA